MEDPQTGMQAVGAGGEYPTIGGDAEENDADGDKGHRNDTAVTKGGGRDYRWGKRVWEDAEGEVGDTGGQRHKR